MADNLPCGVTDAMVDQAVGGYAPEGWSDKCQRAFIDCDFCDCAEAAARDARDARMGW